MTFTRFVGLPLVLGVEPRVPDRERLDGLLLPGDVVPAHLEAAERHRRGRPVRVGQVVVRVGVEVGERAVGVDALRAGEEDVLRLVALRGGAEREGVAAAVPREAVLDLEGLVPQLVVRGERLEPERGVGGARVEDVHHREELADRLAALVLVGVADDQRVGLVAAEDRVPLGDAGLDVLEDLVVRVREVEGGRVACGGCRSRARRSPRPAGRSSSRAACSER